jgi:hypothetical protein
MYKDIHKEKYVTAVHLASQGRLQIQHAMGTNTRHGLFESDGSGLSRKETARISSREAD